MKATALVCTQDQRFALLPVSLPDPGPGEVSIRTLFSGVSVGTEFALVRNKIPWGQFPIVTGYTGPASSRRWGRTSPASRRATRPTTAAARAWRSRTERRCRPSRACTARTR